MLPNFLIIGAVRCATGWISQCLREHPQVFMVTDETRFFDLHYNNGIDWWEQNFFLNWNGKEAVGEKTANYLFEPLAPPRIASFKPEMKLICCLRDPIDRMYSHYILQKARKLDAKMISFKSLISPESELVRRGFYYEQIERYLKFFPRDKVLIKIYEDKDENPLSFIQDIYQFLNIEKNFNPSSIEFQTKKGAVERKNRFWNFLSRYMNRPRTPTSIRLFYKKIRPQHRLSDINTKDLNILANLFKEDLEKLENLIDRDLNCWNTKKIIEE